MNKERPILFSTPMVNAILEGRKTQTRRIMKWKPLKGGAVNSDCLYGKPSDILWVREKYKIVSWNEEGEVVFQYADGSKSKPTLLFSDEKDPDGDLYMEWWEKYSDILIKKGVPCDDEGTFLIDDAAIPWRPSLFMPRAACRILLKVKNIYPQQLQNISEEDAENEGVEVVGFDEIDHYKDYMDDKNYFTSARESFKTLWEKINSADSWNGNPWVWVINFEWIR